MTLLLLALMAIPLVVLLERNHRRATRVPGPVPGSPGDRDLDRLRHDLSARDEIGPQAPVAESGATTSTLACSPATS